MGKKTIAIFIHSYKNKNLIENINKLYSLSNDTSNLFFFIYDQSNINRSKDFTNFNNLKYTYVKWDEHFGIPYYRKQLTNKNFDYFLEINDQIELIKDWDKHLINFVELKGDIVISGKGKTNILINNFIVNKNEEYCDDFYLNNWIDMNFIFLSKNNINNFIALNYLKYYGQDLALLLELISNNVEIYSCPSYFYSVNKKNNLETMFVSYDLYHNYNCIIKKIKQSKIKLNEIKKQHSIDLTTINLLPFETIDVSYNALSADFENSQNTNRYYNSFNSIILKERINE